MDALINRGMVMVATDGLFDSSRKAGEEMYLPLSYGEGITFAWCPAGEFTIGSPDDGEMAKRAENPQHKVRLSKGFWIAQKPVTQYHWEIVMGNREALLLQGGYNNYLLPAEGMTWTNAMSFCDEFTASLRAKKQLINQSRIYLPTEAQWEYACRAGTQTRWHFGDNETELDRYAWYNKNSDETTQPVGTKIANPWGLYDMYGNVSEWCLDNFHLYGPSIDFEIDPIYVEEGDAFKILRGGCSYFLAEDCTSASREMIADMNPFNESTGLRIVCIENC